MKTIKYIEHLVEHIILTFDNDELIKWPKSSFDLPLDLVATWARVNNIVCDDTLLNLFKQGA